MFLSILGRQPVLGIVELERLYGGTNTSWFSDISALTQTDVFDFNRLGGSQKAGRVVLESHGSWLRVSKKIIQHYTSIWSESQAKITLGISAYGFEESARDIQKTGLVIKKSLKSKGVSVRLVPNTDPALNTATSHHNKLGLSENKIELIVVRNKSGKILVAQSVGSQNITALAARDQGRPKTDAFVGMLPPKLAKMMVNYLGIGNPNNAPAVILDPFCGTGTLLQEAALLGYSVYGTDLSEKMVRYSRDNLNWLAGEQKLSFEWYLHEGDATTTKWRSPINAVACETYLGQPFSAPPSPTKLEEVRGNCNHIISSFLKNISGQIDSSITLCIAVPAWRGTDSALTHLPLTDSIEKLGYKRIPIKNARPEQLVYYRESQVVAREILLLTKA